MVPKVRKFSTGVAGQGTVKPAADPAQNIDPDIPEDAIERVSASAPMKIHPEKKPTRKKRRYKQKTYSIMQADIDTIEQIVSDVRQAGLYERGRSDIVRAAVQLLGTLPIEQQVNAVKAVEYLRGN